MTAERRHHGRPGAPGVGLGRLLRVDPDDESPVHASAADVAAAFDAVAAQLDARAAVLRAEGHREPAEVAVATALIARDPELRAAAVDAVGAGVPPGRAVTAAAGRYADLLAALPDPTLAARATDVRQVGRRVVDHLREDPRTSTVDGDVILVAHELGADQLLDPPGTVVGAASRVGGAGAHVAIVARALGVPLVFVDLPRATDGAPAVIDGGTGELTVHPTAVRRSAARAAAAVSAQRAAALARDRALPAVTLDGRPIALLANVSTAADAAAAVSAGAEGAGLVRTELPFLAAPAWPTEAEHAAALRPVLAPLAGRVATVRTLDFAPDKLPPFLAGVPTVHRGLEMMLAAPEALAAQLRAVLDAGAETRLRVLVPMVASVDQLRRCRDLLDAAAARRGLAAPPLGAMIELPQAVEAIEDLAAEADFLSVGSNDLTAALLGLDRRDPTLRPGRASEPVVLRAIAAVAEAGRRHGRSVSVCGDAAADPAVVPVLLATGVTGLSVAPAAIDEVRAAVRASDSAVRASS
ncbi:MAG TPA: putative PEP-binding protein [Micromonosporaceae bacterium]